MIEIKGASLVDTETGEILGSTTPKFQGWKYDKYKAEFHKNRQIRFLEPMTAQELEKEDLQNYLDLNMCVAEQKFDGHRGHIYLTELGNRAFSRRISKETGWYSENTDQMPHIRDAYVPEDLFGTIVDGELELPIENCSCRQVQSVTGALPATAIQNQLKTGFAHVNLFDILYYKGQRVENLPYWKRKMYLLEVVNAINSPYVRFTPIYATKKVKEQLSMLSDGLLDAHIIVVDNYEDLYIEFIGDKKEGLIIKNIFGKYEQKRSKNFIKMKAHKMYDVVIMGYDDPEHYYSGKALTDLELTHDWWEDAEDDGFIVNKAMSANVAEEEGLLAITKFWAQDWIGAIRFGVWKERHLQYFLDVYNGNLDKAKKHIAVGIAGGSIREGEKHHWELIEVGKTSGFDDETRKLISENKDKYLGQVIEVEAQCVINAKTGSLQHPRFSMFRPDKSSEMCTFSDHIRKYKEDK